MGFGKISLKVVRGMFACPFRKAARKYEQIPLLASLGYAGVQGGRAVFDLTNHKDKQAISHTMDGYGGFAAAAGSMLGPGGAILFGAGMRAIVQDCKKNINI